MKKQSKLTPAFLFACLGIFMTAALVEPATAQAPAATSAPPIDKAAADRGQGIFSSSCSFSRGLPPTFVANDELYHKIDLKPNVHVLANAFDDPNVKGGTGKGEPVIWTVPFGQGRVVMMVIGHDLLAMSQPGFMDAFARSAEWAATGDVVPGAPTLSPPTSLPAPADHH